MAVTALVDTRTVQAAASVRGFEQGGEWYAKGHVSGLEDADGGAVALVAPDGADSGDREREVWVGVEDGVLTAECDCRLDNSPASQLCGHAVAVAMAALDAGIRWAPAPSGVEWTDPMEAFEALDPQEEAQVLHALLREQPELRERAWQLAVSVLDVSGAPGQGADGAGEATKELRESTAAAVAEALRQLDAEDLRAAIEQAGDERSEERREADDPVAAVLEPYERDIARRLGLGLADAARAVALGVLEGLRGGSGHIAGDRGEDLIETYAGSTRKLLQEADIPLIEGVDTGV